MVKLDFFGFRFYLFYEVSIFVAEIVISQIMNVLVKMLHFTLNVYKFYFTKILTFNKF